MGLHSNSRLLALSAKIRPGWRRLTMTNTLAYYDTITFTAVKSFIVQAPR